MKYYFLIILVCFYSSCATNQTSVNNDSDINVVDIDKGSSLKTSPVIDNDNNEHIGVGPSLPNSESVSINQSEKKNVWGLILSPGLNRVICHAVAVRALYEKGVRFNVFTGSGMSAVVAAFLSEDITPEVIEWKFHKFFQKTKGMRPFTEAWLSEVDGTLLKDFKDKKIQNTKHTLVIPVYNNSENKIEYVRRGNLRTKLIENLKLSKGKIGKYSTPLERGLLKASEIRELGVQKIVSINVLGQKISFSKNEDYLFGLYGKLSTNYLKNINKEYNYSLNLPLENFALDTVEDLPKYLRTSYLYLRDNSHDLKEDYLNERKN